MSISCCDRNHGLLWDVLEAWAGSVLTERYAGLPDPLGHCGLFVLGEGRRELNNVEKARSVYRQTVDTGRYVFADLAEIELRGLHCGRGTQGPWQSAATIS